MLHEIKISTKNMNDLKTKVDKRIQVLMTDYKGGPK